MNPGKRRKMQKREFLIKMVEENKKSLEKDKVVVSESAQPVAEEVKSEEVVEVVAEVKTTKKKKTV
jgi:hypothetical protein